MSWFGWSFFGRSWAGVGLSICELQDPQPGSGRTLVRAEGALDVSALREDMEGKRRRMPLQGHWQWREVVSKPVLFLPSSYLESLLVEKVSVQIYSNQIQLF